MLNEREARNKAAIKVNEIFSDADVRALDNFKTFQALVQLCMNNRIRYDHLIENLGTRVSKMSANEVSRHAQMLQPAQ